MVLNINKPKGITSHDVVDEVRRQTGERRVGHAGTLDPFATGVLVVAVGREDTKKLTEITKNTKKEYVATLELGKTSTTGDPEGQISLVSLSYPHLSEIKDTLRSFVGEIKQTPPPYSAIKVKGVPAYKLARRGVNVVLPSRKVQIHEIGVLKYSPPSLKIRVVCSAGTYIRSLAKDIGETLGTGAYLTELERTRVGDFTIKDSISLEQLRLLKSRLGVDN
ncbi:tRNA pseudouridine(55) synthase TruB [Patescibacteria group bacterium]|nr:tRNA pseudouridine(55) synthase TruB [Patescibacteria group bacterium]